MNRDSNANFFAGLLVGAIIGLAVGFLYAPQEGHEIRRLVKEKASGMHDQATRAAQKMREAAESRVKREEE